MAANEGRLRLDRTLRSPAFAYKESVNLIVKRHLVKSSLADAGHDGILGPNELALGGKYFDEIAQHWSSKVWTLLEALRSASTESIDKLSTSEDSSTSSRDWKLKDQNDRHRVMYREGPVGTPFHTLCMDGIMDGTMANALCVGWEVPNYKDWFPQFTVPTFKMTEARWLRKVRVGEALSVIRLKVPWPVAPREIVMSAFELEYCEEDIIIVLLESAPDADEINEKLHGYAADDLPAPSQSVRMDLGGGFVMQRMSADQFFFRTVADLDMKLDIIPPWIINFISRQLAGQGLKLYQKTITAVGNRTGSGKAFQQLLRTEPLYDRVRAKFDSKAASDGEPFVSLPVERLHTFKDSLKTKTLQGSILRIGSSENYRVVPFPVKAEKEELGAELAAENESSSKVESIRSPLGPQLHTPSASQLHTPPKEAVKPEAVESSEEKKSKNDSIIVEGEEAREYDDPEVEWALTILDKMIAYSQTCASGSQADGSKSEITSSTSLPAEASKTHVKISSASALPADSINGFVVKDKRKPPLTPVKNQNHKKEHVLKSPPSASINTPQRLVRQSPSMLLSSEETETSGTSGFLSASEIEVLSQDETDAETGASSRISCPQSVQESEVQSRRRRSRWRWGACFSPRLLSRRHHNRKKSGLGDSGRVSEGHWRSVVGDSGRSLNQRGYATDGDERYGSHNGDYPPESDGRFVTLGELLLDDER